MNCCEPTTPTIPPVKRGDGGWIDQSQSARGKLGYVNAGGLILEVFFISNPTEMAVYQARKWLVAQAIADVPQQSGFPGDIDWPVNPRGAAMKGAHDATTN